MNRGLIYTVALIPAMSAYCHAKEVKKPNILFVVADDQSYPHTSAYGSPIVNTPAFDFVAKNGVLFNNAYVTSPGSSPSRASMLTGRYPWQIEEAGTHGSSFPLKYITFPDILKNNGYHIGFTGKGWGPGDWENFGRNYNPAGLEYNEIKLTAPYSGISKIDYTANFEQFISERDGNQPFYFWFGANEPHRNFEQDSWKKENKKLSDSEVPPFLPDSDIIKGDILDYAVEIEWYDSHLARIIEILRQNGELENTIIVVTADNGMAFPHAKANCYDAGIHVPLAICWGANIKQGTVVESLVSTIDLAPTLLDVVDIDFKNEYPMSGTTMLPLLNGDTVSFGNRAVFSSRERHSSSRYNNLGYPIRSVRAGNYLLIRNFYPECYPAGDHNCYTADGVTLTPAHSGYFDIDNSPSKSYVIENRDNSIVKRYFDAAVAKRPEYELYDIGNDPQCMVNLAPKTEYLATLQNMKDILNKKLTQTKDSRIVGDNPMIWESYPRIKGATRKFSKISE